MPPTKTVCQIGNILAIGGIREWSSQEAEVCEILDGRNRYLFPVEWNGRYCRYAVFIILFVRAPVDTVTAITLASTVAATTTVFTCFNRRLHSCIRPIHLYSFHTFPPVFYMCIPSVKHTNITTLMKRTVFLSLLGRLVMEAESKRSNETLPVWLEVFCMQSRVAPRALWKGW